MWRAADTLLSRGPGPERLAAATEGRSPGGGEHGALESDATAAAREAMVREQIAARGVADPRVLAALRSVPRHEFVPPEQRASAYADRPLPIAGGQTISQPYIVARMSELLAAPAGARVLEIGTGSGYQAAVLSAMGLDVSSIEVVPELARSAQERLQRLGYPIAARTGDGTRGWPERAPFIGILVTAAPPAVPEPLLWQLAIGGRLVIPVGVGWQELLVITRGESGFTTSHEFPVSFVPMIGEAARQR